MQGCTVCFFEGGNGGVAGNGVNHHFTGGYLLQKLQPGLYFFFGGVVDALSLVVTFYKKGLNGYPALEFLQLGYGVGQTKATLGLVQQLHGILQGRVQFLYVVVNFQQGVKNGGPVQAGGVGEDGNSGLGAITFTQFDGVVNDGGEVGVQGGFPVPGKGQHIRKFSVFLHLLQFPFELGGYLLACGQFRTGRILSRIEATLAVNTIERAEFTVFGQQIDAE